MPEKRNKGSLFIVSAPSGAGKTTLCKKVLSALPYLKFSVSYTTRQPRKGEVNDREYTFIHRDEFTGMVKKGDFIEWAEIHGELYGTSKRRLEELLAAGNDVLLDIDVQGASQVRKKSREGTYIFILPPSLEVLKTRLEKRMTDSQANIKKRLKAALSEIKEYTTYDYVIMNDVLNDAVRVLEAIVTAHRASRKKINPVWIERTFFPKEDT
ncbi:MAG: guanylate kinase [Thermodesulfovibrionales bacterium]|nr:guanylate kinase [Thermodesulfovibrionales bacterium]